MTARPARTRTDAIEPFWLRLRKISLYPLQSEALFTIGVYAALRLLGFLPGVIGFVLNLVVSVAMFKYAAEVLVATANGRMEAPNGYAPDEEIGWLQVKLQAALFIMALAAALLLPGVLAIAALVFIGFAIPGATMSIAIDRNLWHALNPVTWAQIMGRLGLPYFVAAALCFAFLVSQLNAQSLLIPWLPTWLGVVVFYFIAHYATVAIYHLMGYLVYQYHELLGYEIEVREMLKRPGDIETGLLADAEALVREGATQAAEDLLREEIEQRGAVPAVHDRYRKLLALRGDTERLLKHGREYLNVLVAQDQDRKALELVRECRALDPTFVPADPGYVTRLAHRAAELGQNQLALEITSGFHRAHPKHPDVPRNYLLAARLLAEKFNKDEAARALIRQLQANFPTHPLMPEIEAYAKFLDTLAAPAGAQA